MSLGKLRMVAGDDLMISWSDIKAGVHVPRHSHANEQITWLRSGRMDFQIGDEPVRSCDAGAVVHVPAGTPHETWYREKCEILEVFTPPRYDFFPHARENPYGFPG
jgi:quercetin dioxygenase-like cupin family protein